MSRIFKGIFGGRSKSEEIIDRFQPVGFRTPGLNATFANDEFNLSRGAEGQSAIDALLRTSRERTSAFRGLRRNVTPGKGELTRTRVEGVRATGERTVGNLREELSKRRVLGSSFAQREVASAEAEVGRQEDVVRAESFLQELALSGNLLKEEFAGSISAIQDVLKQLNIETAIGAQLSQSASAQVNANLIAQGEAQAAQQAAGESFLDNILTLIFA